MEGREKPCQFCPSVLTSEEDYLEHMGQHRFVANYSIACFYCPTKLQNIKTYKQHGQACWGKAGPLASEKGDTDPVANSIEKSGIAGTEKVTV